MKKKIQSYQKTSKTRSKTDWDHIRSQLSDAQQTIDKGDSFTPGEQQQILKKRAAFFADNHLSENSVSEQIEILEFQLGNESYAIESNSIREVVHLKNYSPIPGTPDYVTGLTSLRGNIYSIIDLKKLFHLPDNGLTDLNKLILIHSGELELAILADRITEMKQIHKKDIKPSGPTQSVISGKYINGVTTNHLIIINVSKLLSDYGKVHQENTENVH